MTDCAVLTCAGSAVRRGWCCKHYTRFIRHGDPLGGGYGRGDAQEWLLQHVNWADHQCLIWPYYRDKRGYARVSHDGRDQIAARVMCILAHGNPKSHDLQAAHSCGNGEIGCVNPNHIRWATPFENNADKKSHGTQPRGEAIWNAKLCKQDVLQIRRLLGAGMSQRKIARTFGVSQGSVFLIKTGKNWGWLKCE